jgi:hypothetical protein
VLVCPSAMQCPCKESASEMRPGALRWLRRVSGARWLLQYMVSVLLRSLRFHLSREGHSLCSIRRKIRSLWNSAVNVST